MIALCKLLQWIRQFRIQLYRRILIDQQDDVIFIHHGHGIRINLPQCRHLTFVEQVTVVWFRTVENRQAEEFSKTAVQQFEPGFNDIHIVEPPFQ